MQFPALPAQHLQPQHGVPFQPGAMIKIRNRFPRPRHAGVFSLPRPLEGDFSTLQRLSGYETHPVYVYRTHSHPGSRLFMAKLNYARMGFFVWVVLLIYAWVVIVLKWLRPLWIKFLYKDFCVTVLVVLFPFQWLSIHQLPPCEELPPDCSLRKSFRPS